MIVALNESHLKTPIWSQSLSDWIKKPRLNYTLSIRNHLNIKTMNRLILEVWKKSYNKNTNHRKLESISDKINFKMRYVTRDKEKFHNDKGLNSLKKTS